MIHATVLDLVGRTPLVSINRLWTHPSVRLAVKLEFRNPGGSIKDRVALAMIRAAEDSGELTPDKTIIEATSGNTGIGLAMVCAVLGYRLKLLMPDSASEERKRIMRAHGAAIVLTPGRLGTDGAIEEAYRLAREEPARYVLMDQFNNPASISAHYEGTGREIWEDSEGRVTHVVIALGTSGTAMGCVKRLKEYNPAIRVVAVEPGPGHKIQGLKNMRESYPPGIYDRHALDEVIGVEDATAFEMARKLAREEGVLAGMSGGAAMAGALSVAAGLTSGLVVAILPDGGERYLSTTLFASEEQRGPALLDAATAQAVHVDPASARLGLYTFGPAPARPGELDAWRGVVFLDVLGRRLAEHGGRPALAAGVADLDDGALAAAREAKIPRERFAEEAARRIRDLAGRLGVSPDMAFPLASGATDRGLDVVRALLGKGLAYEKLRSVYFDTTRDKGYGRMRMADAGSASLGKTVDLSAYAKDNPRDFTLLKRVSLKDLKQGDAMATPWGNVRPSWFLQMAAAALHGLPSVTVMLAGEDKCFPHLENLRAIWGPAGGGQPLAWMVGGLVTARDGGASPTVDDLLASGLHALTIRMWLLSTAYRRTLVYSPEALAMWDKNRCRVQELAAHLVEAAGGQTGTGGEAVLGAALDKALDDDLAVHRFWPALFTFAREKNTLAAKGRLTPVEAAAALAELRRVDTILGVVDWADMPVARANWPEEVAHLVAERESARSRRDFEASDRVREDLSGRGWRVEDTPSGARLYALSR